MFQDIYEMYQDTFEMSQDIFNMSQDNFEMSQDIFERSMHKKHGDFQKVSVTAKHSKSQVQNDKALPLFNLS